MASLVDRHEVEKLLVLVAALRSGLVDALDRHGPATADEVAAAVGGDSRACRIVLAALASIGVVAEDRGRFTLTPLGRAHLLDPPPGELPGPDLERASLLHNGRKFEGWLDLPTVIATGRPPERDPVRRDVRTFVRTMGEGDPVVLDEVVERVLAYAGEVPGGTMIDIGGAVGHVARAFHARGLRATLLDRPAVLPEAAEFLGEHGRSVAMVAGDFTVDLPPGPFGLAYLGNVLHIYGPETDLAVVRRVFTRLVSGGVIAIRDFVWGRSPRAAMFAVNMLQATAEGGVWTEEQYRSWLAEAGFVDVQVLDLERSQNQLVLGRRP